MVKRGWGGNFPPSFFGAMERPVLSLAVRLRQPLKLVKTPYLTPFESRSPSNEGIDTMYCEVAQGLRPVQKKRIESSVQIGVRT